MSRLFWKFLFFFMLAQAASTACAMSFWVHHGVHAPKPPAQVMVGSFLGSLAVAALLAWYISKPIRALRRALRAAAQGNLDVRIGNNVALVNEVVADATFEVSARSASVGFDVRVESLRPIRITGNTELLHRALDNVVRNSVRYTPSGGRIHILGDYDALRREVRLMFADEGPGVRAADLAFIFEPFFRGEAARRTVGHGLGLAITHRVIESHGGRIHASNRTSGGLAVEICLPDRAHNNILRGFTPR